MKILKATLLAVAVSSCLSAFAGETLDKIKETKTLTIGARSNSIPYSSTNANGTFEGYSQDWALGFKRFLDKKYGLNLDVNKVEVNGQTRQPLVMNKVIDLEAGSTSWTEERAKVLNFSIVDADPVVPAAPSNTSISSVESLKGKRVAVVAGTTGEKLLKKLNNEKAYAITIKLVKDYPQGFLEMSNGTVDAVVTNKVLLAGEIAKNKSSQFKVLDKVIVGEPELIGIMYGKQDPEFTADIKEYEAKIKADGTMDKMFTKWFGPLGVKWDAEQRKAVFK